MVQDGVQFDPFIEPPGELFGLCGAMMRRLCILVDRFRDDLRDQRSQILTFCRRPALQCLFDLVGEVNDNAHGFAPG
jgi:hypothetical protein